MQIILMVNVEGPAAPTGAPTEEKQELREEKREVTEEKTQRDGNEEETGGHRLRGSAGRSDRARTTWIKKEDIG